MAVHSFLLPLKLKPLFLTLTLTLIFSLLYLLPSPLTSPHPTNPSLSLPCGAHPSDLTAGHWAQNPQNPKPFYDSSCPFHRNAWNCYRNNRADMDRINSWSWFPNRCNGNPVKRIEVAKFLNLMKGRKIGFVGDSLNENFFTALLCTIWSGDKNGKKWKRKGAWRGGFFPKFDLVVGYHRAVLLANYTWVPVEESVQFAKDGIKGFYRVDVDVAADDWSKITKFYDVLIFNTGHWWGSDKFPKDKPLVFYRNGKPIIPALGIREGLKVVIESMVSYIEREVPKNTLKLWRTQSPRHFFGGEWNQNGSCLFNQPLKENELSSWFEGSSTPNTEARQINKIIKKALHSSSKIELLNLTHLSEFRADAHPAIWLGKKDAVAVWGQDCLHWCLPGLPDTWVDVLAGRIGQHFSRV